ncbi:MAG: radical SAM protein, partial [Phycisphaerae bacterium]
MALKRLDNPPNPYLSAYQEWLEEPPAVKVEVYEEEAHSILATNDSPDVGFKWSVNPYRGCQHACAYCYARRTHEFLGFGAGTDFETRLVVKINAGQRLEEAFRSKNWKREPVIFSGVTDCYQPLEAVYGLTRSCLEVCRRFHNPIGLVTKSYLVVRDADVLAELAAVASVKVMISIPFRDAATARLIEPGAPPPERRFEALKRLADAGVPVGIMTAPIIPGLNDRDVPELLARAAACGALANSSGTSRSFRPGMIGAVMM